MVMLSIPLLQPAMYSLHSSLAPHSGVFLDAGASFTIIITLCQPAVVITCHSIAPGQSESNSSAKSLSKAVGATTLTDNNKLSFLSTLSNYDLEIVKLQFVFINFQLHYCIKQTDWQLNEGKVHLLFSHSQNHRWYRSSSPSSHKMQNIWLWTRFHSYPRGCCRPGPVPRLLSFLKHMSIFHLHIIMIHCHYKMAIHNNTGNLLSSFH